MRYKGNLRKYHGNAMTQDPRIMRALDQFNDEEIPHSPPVCLPLLDKYREHDPDPQIFANIDVLFIQHHLGPFVPRIQSMIEDGLNPMRCWFVDIPYSTNEDVYHELRKLGCPGSQTAEPFNHPLAPYDRSQSQRVAEILRRISTRRDPRTLLVVDDGAYFARALNEFRRNEPGMVEVFRNSRVVEQTTRGHRYLQEHANELVEAYKLSVVSIARCQTKLGFESPFIGAAVSRAIRRALESRGNVIDRLKHIALIGFGSVGQATTLALLRLKPDVQLDVVEIDEAKHKHISILGCQPMKELPHAKQYDLVAGCTGYNSFKLHQRALLADEAVLASGSSAAVEFNRADFVELADAFPDDEIEVLNRSETIAKGIHATIEFQQEKNKRFFFLNAGFPVNFDGRMECLPTRLIQATHCLLFATSRQALRSKSPGFEKIDAAADNWIHTQALNELGRF